MRITNINKAIENANASLEMEDLKPSKFAVGLAKKHLSGKITKDEVTRLIVKKYIK